MDLLTPIADVFTLPLLLLALCVAGVMQVAKVALRQASEEARDHPVTKVVLSALPMVLGALAGWLMLPAGELSPIALGMVAGLFSTTIYGAAKAVLGKDRLELRQGREG